MKRIKLVLASLMLFCMLSAYGQTIKVSGLVTDSGTGEAIPFASVQVKGSRSGVSTGTDGRYNITVSGESILIFSFIGYKSQEIQVGGRSVIDVRLESEAIALDNVVVVAYGTAKKESFTGSVETVKGDAISKRNTSSLTKAIEGVVAGVQSSSGGGQPGAGSSIRIRGFGSMKASNEPLYVVDGVPYDGYISAINPNDIESVSILKDASASALYGARGANGVVIVTTKRGKEGSTSVNFKAEFGISRRAISGYETVNQAEYLELARELYGNTFMSRLGGEMYNPFNVSSDQLFDSNGKVVSSAQLRWSDDWLKEGENSNPFRQDYQISISGGNEKSRYLMSAGYLKEDGTAKNTSFDRISASINVDSQAASWAKTGMSLMASTTKQNIIMDGGTYYSNIWYIAQSMAPIYPVYKRDSNGNILMDSSGDKVLDYGDTRPVASNSNAVGDIRYNQDIGKNDNLSGRGYVTLKSDKDIPFIKDLSLTANLGFDYYSRNFSTYQNPLYGGAVSAGGYITKYSYRNMSYTFNQLLTYEKQLDKHKINLLLGHEFYSLDNYNMQADKKGFAFPGLYELSAASTVIGAESRTDKYKVESYFSRLNYEYDDKYYFSASFRTDGSSRFHPDSRWGKFWSLGGSWRISQESFLKDINWISNITLKLSYGSQGNDNIPGVQLTNLGDRFGSESSFIGSYYAWQAFYDLGYPNANTGGVFPISLSNEGLRWEKNNNLNAGIESSFFKSRLRFTFEYFYKVTDDLIMARPLPNSTGFASYLDNVGSMVNKGFDLTIGGTPVQSRNFRWSTTLLGSVLNNEVTRLNDGLENLEPTNTFITKIGYPLNSFYTAFHAGVDPDTGAQLYRYYDEDGAEQITDKYNIANANRTDANIIGSRIPDFYGSLSNEFTLYDFDLSFLFTFSLGGKILDRSYFSLLETRNAGQNFHKDLYDRRWRNPGDITDIPKLTESTKYYTDLYLVDASYLSFKNLSLGYTFTKGWVKRAGIESLRLSFTANNLFLLSHRKGMDPQYNFTGTVDYTYVPVKNFSFGIDLKF